MRRDGFADAGLAPAEMGSGGMWASRPTETSRRRDVGILPYGDERIRAEPDVRNQTHSCRV